MTIEQSGLTRVKERLEKLIPTDLLPSFSPAQLDRGKEITKRERILVIKIRSTSEQTGNLTYQELQRQFTQPRQAETKSITTELEEQDVQALGFLINKYQEAYNMVPFDEQIIALIRSIEGYKNPKIKGKIVELKTSEGKSSVIVPILISYLRLKNEDIQVHLVNPYLVGRDYEDFLTFAKALGINEDVNKLSSSHDEEALDKKIVFGLWSDFVHAYQNGFLKGESKFPKKPVLVLDEIDQILQDEAVTPAIISSSVPTTEFISNFFKGLLEDNNHLQPETIFIPDGKKKLSLVLDPKELTPRTEEEFTQYVKELFSYLPVFIKANETKLKSNSSEEISDFLHNNLSFNLFCQVVAGKLPDITWNEKHWQQMKKLYEKTNISFWWDDADLQKALITAFVLRKGENYEIVEETSFKDLIKTISRRSPTSAYREEIKVKSITTGYTERGKEFDSLVNFLLYLKEGIEPPVELTGLATDSIHVFEFYQRFNNILGFTGSASSIAKRLLGGYEIETQLVPEHFPTQRELSIRLTKNFEEKAEIINKAVLSKSQSNSVAIVESSNQAIQVADRLKKTNFETNTLSALNEDDDAKLYQWISHKGERPKILICVKMVGRGVDIQPDEQIKKEGLLLISTTPFEFERSYLQLIGRVGRRGEQGEIITLISPDNNVFSILTKDQNKELIQAFKKRDIGSVEKILKLAWDRWEDKATEQITNWKRYNRPIISLREWLEGSRDLFVNLDKTEAEQIKKFVKGNWSLLLWYFEETFKAWSAVSPLGPFGQGNVEAVWGNFVFEEIKRGSKGETLGKISP